MAKCLTNLNFKLMFVIKQYLVKIGNNSLERGKKKKREKKHVKRGQQSAIRDRLQNLAKLKRKKNNE